MIYALYLTLAVSLVGLPVFGAESDLDIARDAPVGVAIGTIRGVLGKADVAYVGDTLHSVRRQIQGDVGEAIMGTKLIPMLRETGSWRTLTPRWGSQGLDGLFVKVDERSGLPAKGSNVMVAEAKYGGSTLNMTKVDGIQMGRPWVQRRLALGAARYAQVADAMAGGSVQYSEVLPQAGARYTLKVPLPNGGEAVFWRNSAQESWKCTATSNQQQTLQRNAKAHGDLLAAAADGRIEYRGRLFSVSIRGDNLIILAYDTSGVSPLAPSKGLKAISGPLEIPLWARELEQITQMTDEALAKWARTKFPHLSRAEALEYARTLREKSPDLQTLIAKHQQFMRQAFVTGPLKSGAYTALFVAGFEVASALIAGDEVNWTSVGKSALIVGAAGYTGHLVTSTLSVQAMKDRALYGASRFVGGPAVFGGLGGIVAGNVVFAYGAVLLGLQDLSAANFQVGAVTIASGVASVATPAALMTLASTFGVASTGTAISGLSGAAATNASLAWLGGGSLTGWGMAGGTAVMGVATVGTTVVIAFAIYAGKGWYDTKQDNRRIEQTLVMLSRLPYYRSCPPSVGVEAH